MIGALLFLGTQLAGEPPGALAEMPAGYRLQQYDDCGRPGLQPHVVGGDVHTYAEAHVPAGLHERSVAWDWEHLDLVYDGLDPDVDWIVAVTYANEPHNARVQSLWAGEVLLHVPYALPRGGVARLLFHLPAEAFDEGRLRLSCRLEGPVNVVVSAVELWAPLPSPPVLRLLASPAPYVGISGQVLDLACEPVAGAAVELRAGAERLAVAHTDAEGGFAFAPDLLAGLPDEAEATLTAEADGRAATVEVPVSGVRFKPPRFRPVPSEVGGLESCVVGLDGRWRVTATPPEQARDLPLTDPAWRPFTVPGQFRQQGYDFPRDQPIAVATTFTPPAEWAGQRLILRFDAVHGAASYWLNGHPIGESSRLFLPVELDVTDAAQPGEGNRLDLELLVDTPAERLSVASQYAFHSLGGIPRKVRLIALPATHLHSLRVVAGLDGSYRTGQLSVTADVAGAAGEVPSLTATLTGGGLTEPLTRTAAASEPVRLELPAVRAWSAEKPHRYTLRLELRQGDRLLERVERQVGFTRIEVRGRQILLNGERIKLAGACHHEIDPQTGRAATADWADRDVRLFRGANLNYLRTSHYPPTEELLEAADRLGLYVEVEAPYCWVSPTDQLEYVDEVLDATAAMIDACADHPSVLLWSLANESSFNPVFELSHRLARELDPSRPTTFNHAFGRYEESRAVELANLHYPGYPYDDLLPDDPRLLLLGEYMFPVCHEQTDVRVNPGLRELWGHGQAEPDSAWARHAAQSYGGPGLLPGSPPGTWSSIVHSDRVAGGAIWAFIDDAFWFTDGSHAGYAWHHGYWGLVDAWRRPKPEFHQARQIFSPVWFPDRSPAVRAGQAVLRLPVENRYSFTDLAELRFEWRVGEHRSRPTVALAPGRSGTIELPLTPGERGELRVLGRDGEPVTELLVPLGEPPAAPLPQPSAGPPARRDDGSLTILAGRGFELVWDRAAGTITPTAGPLSAWPRLHVSRYDHGDLIPSAPPYALLPDEATRQIEAIEVTDRDGCVEVTVRDRFDQFAGQVTWRLDRDGVGQVSYDYQYDGPDLDAREIGLKLLLRADCDTLRWRRWSEWGVLRDDDIGRPEGTARARRNASLPDQPDWRRPDWPWALDQTELGTNDFRGTKFCVYEAGLSGPSGGVTLLAQADRHARTCLAPDGVWLHLISDCRMGPIVLRAGERLAGSFVVRLDPSA